MLVVYGLHYTVATNEYKRVRKLLVCPILGQCILYSCAGIVYDRTLSEEIQLGKQHVCVDLGFGSSVDLLQRSVCGSRLR